MSDMTLRRAVACSTILLAITAAACDRGGSPAQPTQPTQPTAPAPSFVVSGVVREKLSSGSLGLPINGVKVEAGPTISATTDDDGRYSIVAGGGSFDLKFSKDG